MNPEKKPFPYKPNARSVPWLLALVLLGAYELIAIFFQLNGGALSHLFWWAYGDRYTLRWWLLSCGFSGWSVWCCWHFAFRFPGVPHLLSLVALGLLAGAIGYLFTR